MATWRVALIPLWLFGCTLADHGNNDGWSTEPTDASIRAGFADWQAVMQQLDANCDQLRRTLLQQPQGDLDLAAARAQQAAEAVRLGYGRFEDATVPGFARLARDAESWLLQIALEARQGHGDIAAELYRTGHGLHCTRCHDAHERVHG